MGLRPAGTRSAARLAVFGADRDDRRFDLPLGIDRGEPTIQIDAANTIASVVIFGKAFAAGVHAVRPVCMRDHLWSPKEFSHAG